jgi:purine-nucleoside phosphorylase
MIDLNFKYRDAITHLKNQSPFIPGTALILGSGLGDFAGSTKIIKTIPASEVPLYPSATVEGHKGLIHFSQIENKKLIIFRGRTHFYEGNNLSDCVLQVLLAKKLGCKKIIFTNAAGGINKKLKPGDLMLVESFNAINIKKELAQLIGIVSLEAKNNFLDCPSAKMNEVFKVAAMENGIVLHPGIYFYTKGPVYETPAEIEMIRKFGGDAVGMSTVHEAVFASSLNMEVAILSLITNMASGISQSRLLHSDVTETAIKSSGKFSLLLKAAIPGL